MTTPPDTSPLLRLVAVWAALTVVILLSAWWGLSRVARGPLPTVVSSDDVRADRAMAVTRTARVAEAPITLPTPHWIWSDGPSGVGEVRHFRREVAFESPPRKAVLCVACDNLAVVSVDGEVVAESRDWTAPVAIDVTDAAADGALRIEVRAENEGGPAGLLVALDIRSADGSRDRIVSDASWILATDERFEERLPVADLGAHGTGPWGILTGMGASDVERGIEVAEGFVAELVYTVPRSQGSWVSLAVDGRGRLLASDQSAGLFRLTLDGDDVDVEAIDLPVGGAQGLAFVGEDLYAVVSINRAEGPGLYRVRDTDGDDRFDEWARLRAMSTGGEHGPHAVLQGPDGMLYVVGGNHTPIPDPERSAVPRCWDEDTLLPRLWDAIGHAVGIMAPGGWICRTDLDGQTWELMAIGFRNTYDIAFDRDGELFTYDADMEWDMGAPWYRPTRICHVVSGVDFGWRSGSAKWPADAIDSLPPVIDLGPGSPTGLLFGTGAAFPERYQRAMFALDWTYGTIYAIHVEPDGASYTATRETFLAGRPMPVADAVINPLDGAMYIVVGGRGVPSAIYRVRYVGSEPTALVTAAAPVPAERSLRHRLEAFHGPDAPADALSTIWPALAHDDRSVRHAARVALEHQPAERWRERSLVEGDPDARLQSLVALIRTGDASDREAIVSALGEMDPRRLDERQRRDWLRAWTLCLARLGAPDGGRRRLAMSFAAMYPCGDELADRALCDLLVYLGEPTVVSKTIPLLERPDGEVEVIGDPDLLGRNETYGKVILEMASRPAQRQQVYYALALRLASAGWTPQLRERYFTWFGTARAMAGGRSFSGFLDTIRAEALANVPEADRPRYEAMGIEAPAAPVEIVTPAGPGRAWTVDEAVAIAESGLRGRDFARGRGMFAAAACGQCHRFAGLGRAGGPDLTALSTRYALRDLVESIIDPDRVVSDQYQQESMRLDDGTIIVGRVVAEDAKQVTVMGSMLVPDFLQEIPKSSIVERGPSTVSPMMGGLVDQLGPDELLDLLAFLLSEGDARSAMFTDG